MNARMWQRSSAVFQKVEWYLQEDYEDLDVPTASLVTKLEPSVTSSRSSWAEPQNMLLRSPRPPLGIRLLVNSEEIDDTAPSRGDLYVGHAIDPNAASSVQLYDGYLACRNHCSLTNTCSVTHSSA